MKNKLQTFSEDEALAHHAMQRQLGKWVIEGEKKLKFEEGIEKGKLLDSQTKVFRILLKKYPQTVLEWINDCSYEQLDIIFDQAIGDVPLSQIQQNIYTDNV